MIISQDVSFNESEKAMTNLQRNNTYEYVPSDIKSHDLPSHEANNAGEVGEVKSNNETAELDDSMIVVEIDYPRHSARESRPPARFSEEFATARLAISNYDEPQTLQEALS